MKEIRALYMGKVFYSLVFCSGAVIMIKFCFKRSVKHNELQEFLTYFWNVLKVGLALWQFLEISRIVYMLLLKQTLEWQAIHFMFGLTVSFYPVRRAVFAQEWQNLMCEWALLQNSPKTTNNSSTIIILETIQHCSMGSRVRPRCLSSVEAFFLIVMPFW